MKEEVLFFINSIARKNRGGIARQTKKMEKEKNHAIGQD